MKQFVILLFILCFGIRSFGQTADDTVLIKNIIVEFSGRENAAIVSNVPSGCWDRLYAIVRNGTWKAFRRSETGRDIVLDEKDKAVLLNQIKQNRNFRWNNKMLPQFIKIEADSMQSYLSAENKRHYDLMNEALAKKDTATFYKNKYIRAWAFTISKPIYFRDNSFCLINAIALCGDTCGRSEIAVYKKEESGWIRWLVIEAGDY